MDVVCLKKKLSTYVSEKGYLKNVSVEVLYEVLIAWEEWPGTAKEFYKSLGYSQKQMATLIGKAKRLKREGHFGSDNFKEVSVSTADQTFASDQNPRLLIELDCKNGRTIRFPHVDQLLEFLQKAG